MKNFANKLNARLFNVKFGVNKNYICSGIEAESLDEAKAKAEAIAKDTATEITSDPIFESSLGIESNGIFEISIKGIEQSKVNKFTELLAKFIGGIAVDVNFGGHDKTQLQEIAEVNEFICENEMSVVSL